MKKIFPIVILIAAVFLACCWKNTEEASSAPQEQSADYVNVGEYGAAGDAVLHHPLGVRGGETDPSLYTGWFWAGHFRSLETKTFFELYRGEADPRSVGALQIVADDQEPLEEQILLSSVNPGPFYTPAAGDWVVSYEAADEEKSVYATDDSQAFEQAIAAGGGALYLPEGDYLVSQLTAAKITDLSGPGRIWLKEWRGGVLWYLIYGTSDLVEYQNYGWIDAARFHDQAWRAMHWLTCVPQAQGWTRSQDFTGGDYSPRMEYAFDKTREDVNVWLTIGPAVSKDMFLDEITVCIGKDLGAWYTQKGSTVWNKATDGGVEGAMYHSSWDGRNQALPDTAWTDRGDWIEVTIPKEAFFQEGEDGAEEVWFFHCWSEKNANIGGENVEFTKSSGWVWVKDQAMEKYLTCAIGGDMRSNYWDQPTKEYYIHEAYYGATQYLTAQPQAFYGYNVPDGRFHEYFASAQGD